MKLCFLPHRPPRFPRPTAPLPAVVFYVENPGPNPGTIVSGRKTNGEYTRIYAHNLIVVKHFKLYVKCYKNLITWMFNDKTNIMQMLYTFVYVYFRVTRACHYHHLYKGPPWPHPPLPTVPCPRPQGEGHLQRSSSHNWSQHHRWMVINTQVWKHIKHLELFHQLWSKKLYDFSELINLMI